MLPVRYAVALGLTLAVEVPLYALALTAGWRTPVRRACAVAVLVNLATHPLLWWGLRPVTGRESYPLLLACAELAVCLVEAVLLMAALRRADWLLLVVATGVNAASVLAGFIVAAAG